VKNFPIEEIGPIDGLAFGFPCNDFSLVGKWQGLEGNFGPLYKHGIRALNAHNPSWFVAENVGGLKGANDGEAFQTILEALSMAGKFGYRLYPHLYQFDLYGVPQRRKRIIIVGIRADLDFEFKVPSPSIYESIDVSSKTALEHPPIPADAPNQERTKQSQVVVDRLLQIKPGENAFTANLPEHLRLNVKGATISQIYKRLKADEPAYTVTGSGGGGTHVYHWEEPRALTNRERARLQSFPDDYKFFGSKEEIRKQIGMAVPVKGAEAIFTALFKTFMGVPYESVSNNIQFVSRLAIQEK
jgi:DNA (cytosine-5)-methyltransferase 1